MCLDFRAARSVDDSTSLSLPGSEVLIGLAPLNGSYSHSFRILRLCFFFHNDTPGLDSMQDLFTVCLPGGEVGVVEESDCSKRMLEHLLGCRFDGGHDVLMGKTVS